MATVNYPSSCVSIEDVTIQSTLLPSGVGLANTFTYRYEFKPNILLGLNILDILLVFARPVGTGGLAHVLINNATLTQLEPCKKGSFSITQGAGQGSDTALGGSFATDDAYLTRVEGRISIENWVFIDQITFLFFNYTAG